MNGGIGAVDGGPLTEGGMGFPERCSGVGTILDWPYTSSLEFAALPQAPGCGRDHTRFVLVEWGLEALADDATLIVSELLTNAVKIYWEHGLYEPIALRLQATTRRLRIEVWDRYTEDLDLVAAEASKEAETGRGLAVVEALSHGWGVRRPSYSLKVVWAELCVSAAD